MQPQAFYSVVADDFAAVDGIIRQQLKSRVPLVEKIGDYIISAGGKRLRPLLVLLSGKALGYQAMICACWPRPSKSPTAHREAETAKAHRG